ncbi:FGGY-family carbohydrate kinase [Oscillospiraceae bacterium MB08-C2-2]|nr:FGGY-family carbohydrate kinase [Oscillospiraceae bacterium MB08-C2-2]
MSKYLLVYDIVTSVNKTSLFTTEGELIRCVEYPLTVNFLQDGWAEQSAESWWESTCSNTRAVLEGLDPSHVCAVSFTAQTMVCLCVDREGNPLRPAITWSDRRSGEIEDSLAGRYDALAIRNITGGRNKPENSLRKLAWIREKEPEIYAKTYKMLQCKDYLMLKMTGRFVTDYSDASCTGGFDIGKFDWSRELVEALGLDRAKLPEVFPSTHVVGGITPQAATETGLLAGTPVVLGGQDFACAAVGAGCVEEGQAYLSAGSSSWISMASGSPLKAEGFDNLAHAVPGLLCPLASVQELGTVFKWLKNRIFQYDPAFTGDTNVYTYKNIYPYTGMEELVRASEPGAGGMLYLPYLLGNTAGMADSFARGAYVGLRVEHTREDMLRAALEGITFHLNGLLEKVRQDTAIHAMRVVGNACTEAQWLQIMAGVFGMPLEHFSRPGTADSFGAAILAGVGIGLYSDFKQAHRFARWQTVSPDPALVRAYEKLFPLFRQSYQGLRGVFEQLSSFEA